MRDATGRGLPDTPVQAPVSSPLLGAGLSQSRADAYSPSFVGPIFCAAGYKTRAAKIIHLRDAPTRPEEYIVPTSEPVMGRAREGEGTMNYRDGVREA